MANKHEFAQDAFGQLYDFEWKGWLRKTVGLTSVGESAPKLVRLWSFGVSGVVVEALGDKATSGGGEIELLPWHAVRSIKLARDENGRATDVSS